MSEGYRLDPADVAGFCDDLHRLLDACLDRLVAARERPWIPPPEEYGSEVALDDRIERRPTAELFATLAARVMPFATGNTHPRFFGWVHGTGLPQAVAAEMVAATMNANLGGRLQGGAEIERAVIDWTARVAGLPPDAFGILTTGTSQATILALQAARVRAFPDLRATGIRDLPALRVYAAEGAHSCVKKALEVLGHGGDALVSVPAGEDGMDAAALRERIAQDRSAGFHPLAIVGTAGSVNLGRFDPLEALADIAAEEGLWLHVDAAFGFWTRLAAPPWRALTDGVGRADSIAADFHKWIGVPYDCGICLMADGALQRRAFTERPDYLSAGEGLAGGDLWFCDYGLELSRGFRALKVWVALQACGTDALGAAITDNCRQAALMGELAEADPRLRLAHPVISNVCCFAPLSGDADRIAARLQLSGDAVFSTTRIDGELCLRAAIVNHRTTSDDIRHAMSAVSRAMDG